MEARGCPINSLTNSLKSLGTLRDHCHTFQKPDQDLAKLTTDICGSVNQVVSLQRKLEQAQSIGRFTSDHILQFCGNLQSVESLALSIEADHRRELRIHLSKQGCQDGNLSHEKIAQYKQKLAEISSLLTATKPLIESLILPTSDGQVIQQQSQSFTPVAPSTAISSWLLLTSSNDTLGSSSIISQEPVISFASKPNSDSRPQCASVRPSKKQCQSLQSKVTQTVIVPQSHRDRQVLARIHSELLAARLSKDEVVIHPMLEAVAQEDVKIITAMLNAGFDIDEQMGRFQTTALGEALRCRSYKATKLFVERGASFSIENLLGWTPIYYLWSDETRRSSAVRFLKLLSTRKDFFRLYLGISDHLAWNVIHRAAAFGVKEDIEFLLNAGLDLFTRVGKAGHNTECQSWSALHLSTWYGNVSTTTIIAREFAARCQIDVEDSDGNTPLHMAVDRRKLQIAVNLLRHNASPIKEAKCSWIASEANSDCKGHSALALARDIGGMFEAQFFFFVAIQQLPSKARAFEWQRDIPSAPVLLQTGHITSMNDTVGQGHSFGPAFVRDGNIHQGDIHYYTEHTTHIAQQNIYYIGHGCQYCTVKPPTVVNQ